MKTTCQYCGQEIRNCALRAHENVCRLRPTFDELRDMHEDGLTFRDISDDLGVSRSTVKRWLIDAGLLDPEPRPERIAVLPPFKLVPELAPMRDLVNKKLGCNNNCPSWDDCKTRQAMNLWPLCCSPMEHEVQAAIELGYVVTLSANGRNGK